MGSKIEDCDCDPLFCSHSPLFHTGWHHGWSSRSLSFPFFFAIEEHNQAFSMCRTKWDAWTMPVSNRSSLYALNRRVWYGSAIFDQCVHILIFLSPLLQLSSRSKKFQSKGYMYLTESVFWTCSEFVLCTLFFGSLMHFPDFTIQREPHFSSGLTNQKEIQQVP